MLPFEQVYLMEVKISDAFSELEEKGYFCRMDFWCCSSCGWNAVPEDAEKVVFYHNQDADNLKEYGYCFMAWAGNAQEIISAFEEEGLVVRHNGKENTRILVALNESCLSKVYKEE